MLPLVALKKKKNSKRCFDHFQTEWGGGGAMRGGGVNKDNEEGPSFPNTLRISS